MPRFSLRFLLIGIAVASVALAAGAYLWKAYYLAPQAERNLDSYRFVSGALIDFVDRNGRWPSDEEEPVEFAYEGFCSVGHRREEPFERAIVAYDFDFDRDSLSPEAFRGLRYRHPIDAHVAETVQSEFLKQLEARRSDSEPPPRYFTYIWTALDGSTPVPENQASPDDPVGTSTGDDSAP